MLYIVKHKKSRFIFYILQRWNPSNRKNEQDSIYIADSSDLLSVYAREIAHDRFSDVIFHARRDEMKDFERFWFFRPLNQTSR